MSETVLELHNTLKRHSQGGATFELQIPELRLEAGQFVAVVGESGCGKSTLLDMLALISRPLSCERFIYVENHQETDLWALWERKNESALARLRRARFGYVLQTGGLLPFLSVAQNITLAARMNRMPVTDLREKATRIGIAEVLEKKPQYLSGGQRQRAAVLRAVQHQPRIVLADEPTGAVDKQRARGIVEDLAALAEENHGTIVMVTHDQDLVAPFAQATYGFDVEQFSATLVHSTCRKLN